MVAVLRFFGLLILAAAVSYLLALLNMNPWLHSFLVFAVTKILADIIRLLLGQRVSKYVFFEDYLRETFVFLAVSAVCVLGIALVHHYLLGKIWLPLPVAAIVAIWLQV